MKIKRLYIHDDSAESIVTDDTLSVRKEDAAGIIHGHVVGEIHNSAKGWLDGELQLALVAATAPVCDYIKAQLIKLPSMRSWVGAEHFFKIAMASKTLYVYLDRPCEGKISLSPADLSDWAAAVNGAQDVFEIGEPRVTSGGYEGCTLQMSYKLLKTDAELS